MWLATSGRQCTHAQTKMSLPSDCILNSTMSEHLTGLNTTGAKTSLLNSCPSKVDIYGNAIASNKNVKCDIVHGNESEVINY